MTTREADADVRAERRRGGHEKWQHVVELLRETGETSTVSGENEA